MTRRPLVLTLLAALCLAAPLAPAGAGPASAEELRVLQLNVWMGGGQVPGGVQGVADVVGQTDADVVLVSEDGGSSREVVRELGGSYAVHAGASASIISRHPIVRTDVVDGWTKAVVDVDGTEVAVYSGHLNYRHYATYLPRGYGAGATGETEPEGVATWDPLPGGPWTDVAGIEALNERSGRPDAARSLVRDAAREQALGREVVVGGDFNEPSHLDWTERTADRYDRHGTSIAWATSRILADAGLRDAYRAVHPDERTHPGFTWPSSNPAKAPGDVTWAPTVDERDRIDFVHHAAGGRLSPTQAVIVGPRSTVVRGEDVPERTEDPILEPTGTWPSDHKGNLVTFAVGG